MALYDNQHWLLSYIRDNFISIDSSGMMEMVLLAENIPKQLKNNGFLQCYPEIEDSDEDIDVLSESYDIEMDMKTYNNRERTNTARRLEKMEQERKMASKITHIKWKLNPDISLEEQQELFKRKDFRKKKTENDKRHSLFAEQLDKCPTLLQNPFIDFAKFDGSTQFEEPVKKYRICMCIVPKEQRLYPLQIVVIASATVQQVIGFICYKYNDQNRDQLIKYKISQLGLYMTEDDEIDWDFPCLDPSETIGKFDFTTLGLAEMKPSDKARYNNIKMSPKSIEQNKRKTIENPEEIARDLAMMGIHTTAMEAPLYKLFRVYIINKVRVKTEVHLGISGEKIEIDPVVTGKGASRFWSRQRSVSHNMDNVAWCELMESKGSKAYFTLVYTVHSNGDGLNIPFGKSQSLKRSTSFKNHEFEADSGVAMEIVRKINNILELRYSSSRKNNLLAKERKTTRRISFRIPR